MFLNQERKILDIGQNGTTDTNSQKDRLTREIKNNSTRLDVPRKEIDKVKLSIEAS